MFIIPSILISLAFAPVLLSVGPTPAFQSTRPVRLRQIFDISPLAFYSVLVLGAAFAAQFAISPLYGTKIGLTQQQIAIFFGAIYFGAIILQYPVGWLSDKMDRRLLIIFIAFAGGFTSIIGALYGANDWLLLVVVAFFLGGTINPLYSLTLAYINDYLDPNDMAGVASGLQLLMGITAAVSPVLMGFLMTTFGPNSFFYFCSAILTSVAVYGIYRTFNRRIMWLDRTAFSPVAGSSSAIAIEAGQQVGFESIGGESIEEQPAEDKIIYQEVKDFYSNITDETQK